MPRNIQEIEIDIKRLMRELRDGDYPPSEKDHIWSWIGDASTELFNRESDAGQYINE